MPVTRKLDQRVPGRRSYIIKRQLMVLRLVRKANSRSTIRQHRACRRGDRFWRFLDLPMTEAVDDELLRMVELKSECYVILRVRLRYQSSEVFRFKSNMILWLKVCKVGSCVWKKKLQRQVNQ